MKIYEILKQKNIDKVFIDNKGDYWMIRKHVDNLVLIMASEESSRSSIIDIYYLDDIFELDFQPV